MFTSGMAEPMIPEKHGGTKQLGEAALQQALGAEKEPDPPFPNPFGAGNAKTASPIPQPIVPVKPVLMCDDKEQLSHAAKQAPASTGMFFKVTDPKGANVGLRNAPSTDNSSRAGGGLILLAGEAFEVSEIVEGEPPQRFLRLKDGRGWVFTHSSRDGRLLISESTAEEAAIVSPNQQLLQDAPATLHDSRSAGAGGGRPARAGEWTKEELVALLREIVESQDAKRLQMKVLTKELRAKPTSFDETYNRVKAMQLVDPQERHGVTMVDLDCMIHKHENDPNVMMGVQAIMGDPSVNAQPTSNPGKVADVKTLVEVHKSMLQELEKVTSMVLGDSSNKSKYDMKTVELAAQAVIGAKLEESWGLTSEDIERALIANREELAVNIEFAAVNMNVQVCMQKLLEA